MASDCQNSDICWVPRSVGCCVVNSRSQQGISTANVMLTTTHVECRSLSSHCFACKPGVQLGGIIMIPQAALNWDHQKVLLLVGDASRPWACTA